MSEVIITVRGEHDRRVSPERAVVALSITVEGPDRSQVVERIAALAEPVTADLAARKDVGGVVEWSSKRVSVWSERPWNEGRRLAPVYHATVDMSATFDDPAALSWWVGEVAERDGVQIGDVIWQLTRETRASVEREVASEAVGVAVERATAYASALGLVAVTPLEVADVGLLVARPEPAPASGMMRAAFMTDAAGSPGLQFQPDDIVVSAAVEARFSAR
ncbi:MULTISPECIES: SIMPL domain-containing protein [unclassified Microbacterium]|uniref:SIMPL domain-containing protein n=1 Tax=unclassified Microbacterium TaxID=2609290 RepID=UPI00214B7D25|nr:MULTISPECIES: SIMPL domain-containing protein [unclassified Microbacterium]MCR2784552.1 SIMPL domain-containing protein [Microbacterium sp. zg.B96]MDL5350527.1 SIMPL domain-containing protein [Microbacterium sp. zg-YB36]WIM14638.1 SIMPL domain-containing protein [Microbacterium sp. zg-B96]